ncbi:MAG: ABC transporter ATP-binding protein [Chloroherpetonaceae bacterium]|nr:ABC transporter ATP-binding protein [Chloroherpetonaceae bacterium]
MIELNKVRKVYNEKSSPVEALKDASFSVSQSDIVALIGSSGSGKTTLLNMLSAIDIPTSGTVVISGEDISLYSQKKLTEFRRSKVGIVFQFFNLMPTLSVLENVTLPALLAGKNEMESAKAAEKWLERVALAHRMNYKPHTLSGGEMQRTAIARALINNPEIIIADEPTGNLDSKNAAIILNLIKELASEEKTTLIIATHSKEVANAANRVISIKDGVTYDGDEIVKG